MTGIVVAVMLPGCALSYTPRVPGWFEGYEDERLGWRTWTVRAGAGWPIETALLQRFALYRAAEIATAHGFSYFAVLQDSDVDDVALYAPDAADPGTASDNPRLTFFQRMSPGRLGARATVVRLSIRLLEDRETIRWARVVDARKVLAHLRPVVVK